MDDLISRKAAIDAIDDWWITVDDNRHPADVIKAVPSAQPEIIRCKDCKWFGKVGCAVMIADDYDKPTENDYCSFAERRD